MLATHFLIYEFYFLWNETRNNLKQKQNETKTTDEMEKSDEPTLMSL